MQAPSVCRGVSKAATKPVAPAVCQLLHPTGMTLSCGQPIVVSVPAALGTPSRLQLSQEEPDTDAFSDKLELLANEAHNSHPVYIACWSGNLFKDELCAAHLQVVVGDQLFKVTSCDEQAEDSMWTSGR